MNERVDFIQQEIWRKTLPSGGMKAEAIEITCDLCLMAMSRIKWYNDRFSDIQL